MLFELRKFPDPVLLKKVSDVQSFEVVRSITNQFIEAMERFGGIGLAANQVGVLQAFFAMKVEGIEGIRQLDGVPMTNGCIMICNPKILADDGQVQQIEEGCLSLPTIRYALDRKKTITLDWQDEFGAHHKAEFSDLASVCIQHEMDHLSGILMLDHLSKLKRQRAEEKLLKLRKNEKK